MKVFSLANIVFLFLILPLGLGCSIMLVIGEIIYFKKKNGSENQKILTTTTIRKTPSHKAQKLIAVLESQPEKK